MLGPQTVQQEIKTQLESFMGTAGANELESIIKVTHTAPTPTLPQPYLPLYFY